MRYLQHTRSKLTAPLWCTMAVFFLLFCSSPVKKYIRMQLYKHVPVVENTQGDRFAMHDIKDCLIADRPDHAQTSISTFFHLPGNAHDDADVFFVPALLSFAFLLFFKRDAFSFSAHRQRPPALTDTPRYLLVRHLQV